MTQAAEQRYDTLDGMRGVAALAVMLLHLTASSPFAIFKNAAIAVDLFFMLSGFVIAHSYGARIAAGMTFADYIGRRIVRLYPLLLVSVALGVAVLLCAQSAGWTTCSPRFILASLLYNALFIPDIHSCGIYNIGFPAVMKTGELFPGNPPLWSLFFEMVASCGFYALSRLTARRLARVALASFSLLLLLSLAFALSHGKSEIDIGQGWGFENFTGGFPRVLFGFSVGMALHALVDDERWRGARGFVARNLGSPLPLYALLVAFLAFPDALGGVYPALAVAVAAPFLVWAGSIVAPKGPLAIRLARALGWISYPVYCLHLPIGRAVYQFAEQGHYPRAAAIAGSVVLTLALACVVTRAYDEPVRSWLSRRLARLVAPPATTAPTIEAVSPTRVARPPGPARVAAQRPAAAPVSSSETDIALPRQTKSSLAQA